MTFALEGWPAAGVPDPGRRRNGTVAVWAGEMTKLASALRVRTVMVLCVAAPFALLAAFRVQHTVPEETLFGQYVDTSGRAVPLVILGFVGQWALPVLVSVVAGDMFSSEDHFRTWKTVLTRSCSRGQVFTGKVLAAMAYSVVMLAVLAASSTAAGLLGGGRPLLSLSGLVVDDGHADVLIVASWATQLAPVVGFCAVAILLSVLSRNGAVGIGGPLVVGLAMQLSTLVSMPARVRAGLLATPFGSWYGFWVHPAFYGPFREGLVTSAAWTAVCLDVAWLVFRFRDVSLS